MNNDSLNINLQQPAAHVLSQTKIPQPEDNNRKLYILVSILAGLVIIIGGHWAWINFPNKKQAVITPTEIPLAEPTLIQDTSKPDEFAGWKTYKDTNNFGFEFKYPKDWYFNQNRSADGIENFTITNWSGINLIAGQPGYGQYPNDYLIIGINIEKNTSGQSAEQILNKLPQYIESSAKGIKNEIFVDNIKGVRFDQNNIFNERLTLTQNITTVIFTSDNNVFYIFGYRPSSSKYVNYFDQILSTFRLTGQSQ